MTLTERIALLKQLIAEQEDIWYAIACDAEDGHYGATWKQANRKRAEIRGYEAQLAALEAQLAEAA